MRRIIIAVLSCSLAAFAQDRVEAVDSPLQVIKKGQESTEVATDFRCGGGGRRRRAPSLTEGEEKGTANDGEAVLLARCSGGRCGGARSPRTRA